MAFIDYILKVPRILKFQSIIFQSIASILLITSLTIIFISQGIFEFRNNKIRYKFYFLSKDLKMYYYNVKMKIILLSILLCTLGNAKSKQSNKEAQLKETIVTFMVQEDIEQEKQIINLSLKLSKNDPSLVEAIQKAKQLQSKIRDIFYVFCVNWNELLYPERTTEDCEQEITSNQYQIEAEYYHLRGDELFKTFNVQFEMTLKVREAHHIGDLIDQFSDMIDDGNIIMSGISWEDSIQQASEQDLIDQGVSKAKLACKNLGMELHRIKSVQVWQKPEVQPKTQIKPPTEEGEQGQEQEQEEQQEQQSNAVSKKQGHKYKFVVVCRSQKQKAKKKSSVKPIDRKITKNAVKSS